MAATPAKLPSPPARANSSSHISDTHSLVRERRYSGTHDLTDLLRALRDAHSTGTLSIDISNGGVGAVRFREEQRVDFNGKQS